MASVIEYLNTQLAMLDKLMLEAEQDFRQRINNTHPSQHNSAGNLVHYLALRSKDIRELQVELHKCGLSSLASSESHIRSQLQAILQRLNIPPADAAVVSYKSSRELCRQRSVQLFGIPREHKIPSIMVTLDSSHAESYAPIKTLLESGMHIARINCSHDDEYIWLSMIEHVKKASIVSGLPCRIYMDLPGPKTRTYLPAKKKKNKKLKVRKGSIIYLAEKSLASKKKSIIGCTMPGVIRDLRKGERVLFDDGMIESQVTAIFNDRVKLEIQRVSCKKSVIKSEKGINLPDSKLSIPALTNFDLQCLSFIQQHADMVGYSFVHNAGDLMMLQRAMSAKQLPIVIKIETLEAVKNLPELLLQGMQEELFAVMIARGDLAVEIGFERLSEIQEEILWVCDAAHVPVIWATQVLENLNKSGIATRSEVTDAAHAVMAECVLINKGSYTPEVIKSLKDILNRSGTHHAKKRYTFRPLSIASNFMASAKRLPDQSVHTAAL